MGLLLEMRSYTIKKINHKVYDDVTEVPDDLVVQPNWKVGEIGDWVLCDDGSVIEILRTGWVKLRKNRYRYVGTCTGTFQNEETFIHLVAIRIHYIQFVTKKTSQHKNCYLLNM